MGRDKALIEIDGVPMAKRVATALQHAGAQRVRCVGGDPDALAALGLEILDDAHPGAGPLDGVCVALRASATPMTVVAPCDLVDPRSNAFVELVRALERELNADVAVSVSDGTWRPLPCALRPTALPVMDAAFAAGERAVHRSFAGLRRTEATAVEFPDADVPEDLPDRR